MEPCIRPKARSNRSCEILIGYESLRNRRNRIRRWRRRGKAIFLASAPNNRTIIHAWTPKFSLKGSCAVKYLWSCIRSTGTSPLRYILLKCDCVVKHVIHGIYARCVPARDVSVKGRCVCKHVSHVRDFWNVPIANILVKYFGIIKHLISLLQTWGVPIANVSIKAVRITKHIFHIRYARSIPTSNITVEFIRSFEHLSHVCDLRNI